MVTTPLYGLRVSAKKRLPASADADERLRALDEFVASFEAEHGEITEAEMREAARRALDTAVVVRGVPG